jgi:hypothetical protein
VFEVVEDAAGIKDFEDFGVEGFFAFVGAVMDREAGDDGVELAERRKRFVEVVVDDGDFRVVAESRAGGFEHGWREIEGDGFGLRAIDAQEGEKATVPGSEVENTTSVARNEIYQNAFALDAVRNFVGAREVFEGVFGCGVFVQLNYKYVRNYQSISNG